MRHFTQAIDRSCTYVLSDRHDFVSSDFVGVQLALMVTMGSNPDDLSPGEETVLAEFISWFARCKNLSLEGKTPIEPVFVYANLNEGHSVTCIFARSDGDISYIW